MPTIPKSQPDVFAELMQEFESDRYSLPERLLLASHLTKDAQDPKRTRSERERLIQHARSIIRLVDNELKAMIYDSISRG